MDVFSTPSPIIASWRLKTPTHFCEKKMTDHFFSAILAGMAGKKRGGIEKGAGGMKMGWGDFFFFFFIKTRGLVVPAGSRLVPVEGLQTIPRQILGRRAASAGSAKKANTACNLGRCPSAADVSAATRPARRRLCHHTRLVIGASPAEPNPLATEFPPVRECHPGRRFVLLWQSRRLPAASNWAVVLRDKTDGTRADDGRSDSRCNLSWQ